MISYARVILFTFERRVPMALLTEEREGEQGRQDFPIRERGEIRQLDNIKLTN